MKRTHAALVVATLFLAGCATVETEFTIPTDQATQGSASAAASASATASASAAATAESVICDFFAIAGPNDDLAKAANAAISQQPGEAVATRHAIDSINKIAELASGVEKKDLLTLAGVLDNAALHGKGYAGWADAFKAFYVKYAGQCGAPIASD